jgi:hypothetical protein
VSKEILKKKSKESKEEEEEEEKRSGRLTPTILCREM